LNNKFVSDEISGYIGIGPYTDIDGATYIQKGENFLYQLRQ